MEYFIYFKVPLYSIELISKKVCKGLQYEFSKIFTFFYTENIRGYGGSNATEMVFSSWLTMKNECC